MTCLWDALRNKLQVKENNKDFILYLKKSNKMNNSILWNNEKLSVKQLEENFEHIQNFDETKIGDGYDCSTCDPFLILICEIYDVNIHHNYNGHIMKYVKGEQCKILNFNSNSGHFS